LTVILIKVIYSKLALIPVEKVKPFKDETQSFVLKGPRRTAQ